MICLTLKWFYKDGKPYTYLIDEEDACFHLEDAIKIIEPDEDDQRFAYVYEIDERNASDIQPYFNHKINLDKYIYNINGYSKIICVNGKPVRLVKTVNPLKHNIYVDRNKIIKTLKIYRQPTQADREKFGEDLDCDYKHLLKFKDAIRQIYINALQRLEEFYQPHGAHMDFDMTEYKDNPESIVYGALDKLDAFTEELIPETITIAKEFLNTPKGQELEAWKKWDAYWRELERKLDYDEHGNRP